MPRALAALCALLFLSHRAAAASPWVQTSSGASTSFLLSIQSPDRAQVFAAGGALSTGLVPLPHPLVLASSAGGTSWSDITGSLSTETATVSAIFFVDAQSGFAAVGTKLFRTSNRGATWDSTDTGTQLGGLYFHDALHGAIGGTGTLLFTSDGGKTFTASKTNFGSTITWSRFYFADANDGWVSGYDQTNQTAPASAKVLVTSDGGARWTATGALPANVGLGPVFFLPDGNTGWVAGFQFVQTDHPDARLYKTTNAGATWTDTSLPLQVGTIQGFLPINTSVLQALYFSDAQNGHLGGAAFIANSSSSGGGSSSSDTIYKVVDYITTNGGTTWSATNLGNVSLSSLPANDGQTAGGLLLDSWTGWMCGGEESAYSYQRSCAQAGDCGPGYACEGGVCVYQPPSAPDGGSGSDAGSDAGGSDAGGSNDGGGQGADGGSIGDGGDGGTGGSGGSGGSTSRSSGCAEGGATALCAAVIVAFALRRRRRATP